MNNKMSIEERLDFLEFRQNLLFTNLESDRLFFEHYITKKQYDAILNVMDECLNKIGRNEALNNNAFENEVDKIVGFDEHIDYHFCENLTLAFMNDGRYKNVFPQLYGHLPKYKELLEK